ncbi:3-phosphoserine/phosphohydroxythreonine transaminase [Cytobacillus firmus]|uniref:3-phosphoserine/phosphohydroxythreonine transaminase n=1 Tax=Cytobacillus firmus TaxID=1399 RepID=UPI0021877944|nr:3-phosphoserine/phosphohydroxythreonine transaminase [Cytobacillus firmus]URM32139.1 3-phosphoserine/phosphohydroxythreonine transaminase [Cytobacillus firmus]
MYRALNFNAGPAALPEEVLKEAEKSLLNFGNTGMGIMELSHRSKEYQAVHDQAITRLRRLLAIPDDFEVLFIQGGASLQFSMVPMNLLGKDQAAHYVLSGSWSEKAIKEADKIGETVISASSKDHKYSFIPEFSQDDMPDNAAYLHITSNNTIYGTQWQSFPSNKKTPVVADMSSDILSRPLKVDQFDLVYAGAQKNLGPSGVTVVIIRKELLKRSSETLPVMLNYNTFANNNSLYNTPPTLSIYLLSLVLQWAEQIGGLQQIEKANERKAKMLYDVIDESEGFYIGHAQKNSRSRMNVTFNLHSEDLSREFQKQAKEAGFVGLGGHRSIGGCRASIYNAVPEHHVEKLAAFMKAFKNNN